MSSSGAGGGQSGAPSAYANRTSGDIVLNSGVWANVDTGTDVQLSNVQAGQLVAVSVSLLTAASALTATFFDVVSVVANAPVNSWGLDAAPTVGSEGVQAWRCDSNSSGLNQHAGGLMVRRVVAGDLAAGVLKLRLRYRQPAANNVTLFNNNTRALQLAAINLG